MWFLVSPMTFFSGQFQRETLNKSAEGFELGVSPVNPVQSVPVTKIFSYPVSDAVYRGCSIQTNSVFGCYVIAVIRATRRSVDTITSDGHTFCWACGLWRWRDQARVACDRARPITVRVRDAPHEPATNPNHIFA